MINSFDIEFWKAYNKCLCLDGKPCIYGRKCIVGAAMAADMNICWLPDDDLPAELPFRDNIAEYRNNYKKEVFDAGMRCFSGDKSAKITVGNHNIVSMALQRNLINLLEKVRNDYLVLPSANMVSIKMNKDFSRIFASGVKRVDILCKVAPDISV